MNMKIYEIFCIKLNEVERRLLICKSFKLRGQEET